MAWNNTNQYFSVQCNFTFERSLLMFVHNLHFPLAFYSKNSIIQCMYINSNRSFRTLSLYVSDTFYNSFWCFGDQVIRSNIYAALNINAKISFLFNFYLKLMIVRCVVLFSKHTFIFISCSFLSLRKHYHPT